jgi:hypothetical protein
MTPVASWFVGKWFRALSGRPSSRRPGRKPRHLTLEALEDRALPSTLAHLSLAMGTDHQAVQAALNSGQTSGAVGTQGSGGSSSSSPSSTTTTLISSADPAVFGQSVIFTATVASNVSGSGIPVGTVAFEDGTTTLGSVGLNGSGQATWVTNTLAVGNHAITAVYAGNGSFSGSTSSPLSETVNKDGSTAVVASSADPSVFGSAVTFTAMVTAAAPGAGLPTGTITFLDGSTVLGTGTLAGGSASITTGTLMGGAHSVTVTYAGDGDFTGSTSPILIQNIGQALSHTTLASLLNPAAFDQFVLFRATVTGSGGTPTGTVNFEQGTTILGSASLSGGTASFATSGLGIGTHAIFAVYGGNANFAGSTSNTVTQTITQDSTTTVLVSSLNPSTHGQMVTFTATVNPAHPTSVIPTGTMTFRDNNKVINSQRLGPTGKAVFATNTLAVGNHPLVAIYSGDTNFLGSNSNTVIQVVNPGGPAAPVTIATAPPASGPTTGFAATITIPTWNVVSGPSGTGSSQGIGGAPAALANVTLPGRSLWAATTPAPAVIGQHSANALVLQTRDVDAFFSDGLRNGARDLDDLLGS